MLKNIIISIFIASLVFVACDKDEEQEESKQQTECLAEETDCTEEEAGQQAGAEEAGQERIELRVDSCRFPA